MLQPSSKWCWYFDSQHQCLALELDEMLFLTPYRQKQLLPAALQRHAFSLDDLAFYSQIAEKLEYFKLQFSPAQATQIAINATAVKQFYRPLMPKSWYFKRQHSMGQNHGFGMLENSLGQGSVVLIEKDKISSLCMLVSNRMQLDQHHNLEQFAVIKVMNDCIFPYLP
ncbi:cell division protein ZapC domain-containing protein [Neptunicella sp. SCSIO 80796]|uniref:cell division protein ZapC domain-containing protein n=1 Tax=Neptunicella plasticusilytica TaxID=3117012 RepID=UPI003A4E2190